MSRPDRLSSAVGWESAPSSYARTTVTPPILSTSGLAWQNVQLQRFKVPYHDLRLDAAVGHRLTLHLAGPILINRTRKGHRDQRWSNSGCSNLIPAGVPATRSFKGQADFLVLHLSDDLIAGVATETFEIDPAKLQLMETMASDDKTIDHLGRLFLAEAGTGAVGTGLYTELLARALATHLLRTYADVPQNAITLCEEIVGWRLRRAIDYMHAHIDEDLTLAQLAAETGIGIGQFTRAFREATGLPPYRYLLRLRIGLAMSLLENTKLPITDIAMQCGFDQPNHLATTFRKAVGSSPRGYRQGYGRISL